VATYLDSILAYHRGQATNDERDAGALRDQALATGPARTFGANLRSEGLSVIAEIKRKSPSKGLLGGSVDAGSVAAEYERGGARAISVLTDSPHFGGSAEDLMVVKASCALPILRKDFCVDIRHIYDAKIMGADAILLIVAALEQFELEEMTQVARDIGVAALVEVHDEDEARRALDVGADIIGVNQRDLVTFTVDHERACRVASSLPTSITRVAESGVRGPEDAAALVEAGFDAILVGESLITSDDREQSVRALHEAKQGDAS
jgi:indole-3-glycerol phosphate synthase